MVNRIYYLAVNCQRKMFFDFFDGIVWLRCRQTFSHWTGFSLTLFCGPALIKVMNVWHMQMYYNSQVIMALIQ